MLADVPRDLLLAARPTRLRLDCLRGGGTIQQAVGAKADQTADRRGLLLFLRDEAGRVGVGEASPLPGASPDTLSDCEQALLALGEVWHPHYFDDDGWPPLPSLANLPAARCAFETAYADLWAQRVGPGVRLASVLARGAALTPHRVQLNALCDSLPSAQRAVAAGARTLKIKIGGPDFAPELKLLRTLRQGLPPEIALRVDVNGAWTLQAARHHLPQLADLALQYVEQPVPAGRGELAQLALPGVPLAADESLQIPVERAALLHHPSCVAWVLKPMLLGLRGARALALLAAAHGRGAVITHAFDGPVAHAAACELALSLPVAPWACGLAAHAGLAAWPGLHPPHLPLSAAQPLIDAAPPLGSFEIALPASAGLGFGEIALSGITPSHVVHGIVASSVPHSTGGAR